jgi:hypothetical protein
MADKRRASVTQLLQRMPTQPQTVPNPVTDAGIGG